LKVTVQRSDVCLCRSDLLEPLEAKEAVTPLDAQRIVVQIHTAVRGEEQPPHPSI
jgi:hypothetical protein